MTLKPGLPDPQGKAVEGSLPTLGWSNVARRARRQAHPADGRCGRRSGGAAQVHEMADAAAVQPRDRALPDPARPRRREAVTSGIPRIGVITFPGSLDDRDALRAVETMGGEPVAALARGPRPPRRRRRDPARRVQLRRLPPDRRDRAVRARDGRRPRVRRARRSGAGDLQRLPGPLRERAASRRADPQPFAPVRVSRGPPAGGDHADAGHDRPDAGRGARYPGEARRGAVRRRCRRSWLGSRARARSCSATARRTGPSTKPTTRTAARTRSPASATRPATSSA